MLFLKRRMEEKEGERDGGKKKKEGMKIQKNTKIGLGS